MQYEQGNDTWKKLQALFMQLRKCCNHPYLFPGAEPDFDGSQTGKQPCHYMRKRHFLDCSQYNFLHDTASPARALCQLVWLVVPSVRRGPWCPTERLARPDLRRSVHQTKLPVCQQCAMCMLFTSAWSACHELSASNL